MSEKTKILIDNLELLIPILNKYAPEWIDWAATSMDRLKNGDYSGVDRVLGVYGGMGSFNDLVIACEIGKDGKVCNSKEFAEMNNKLDKIRHDIYLLADYIKRNHEINE